MERAEQVATILELMAEGLSLRKSCEPLGVPASTFIGWVDKDPELCEQYTRARARMLDAQAEALEDIGERAAQAENAVEVAGLRLQSDNRKWLLSKLAPKKYGDKIETTLKGGMTVRSAKDMTDDELAAHIQAGSGP